MSSAPSEYLDLHINLEDMPEQVPQPSKASSEVDPMRFAVDFIKRLQQLLSSGSKTDLYQLYQSDYQFALQNIFKDKPWPEPHQIQSHEQIQINLSTQSIYNQLIFRSPMRNLNAKQDISQLAEKSWENYLSILEHIALKDKINLPAGWVWQWKDIVDEFVFQLYEVAKWRATAGKGLLEKVEELWSVGKTEEVLRNLYEGLTETGKLELIQECVCRELFQYFGLIGHFRVKVLLGKYHQALQLISKISLDHTIIFSKAFGSQVSLFYNASFCYFMQQQYLQSAKLAQTIAFFYDKYKKFVNRTSTQQSLSKRNNKVLALWCLAHVFEGNEPLFSMIDLVKDVNIKTKERMYNEALEDKLEKLQQFDQNTLLELFGYAAPKKINAQGVEIPHDIEALKERLANHMKFNFNIMLKLYTRIELAKAAKFLGLAEKDVLAKIEDYGKRKVELKEDKVWDKTILKPLLKIEGDDNISIVDGIIVIQREVERKHNKDYANLMTSVGDITKKLKAL